MKMKLSKYDQENSLKFFMTLAEEKEYYEETLNRVISNPRFYLDNLDELYVYRVSFINYEYQKPKPL